MLSLSIDQPGCLKISLRLSSEHNAESHQTILRRFSCQICDLLLPSVSTAFLFRILISKPPTKKVPPASLTFRCARRDQHLAATPFSRSRLCIVKVLRNFFFRARSFLLSGFMLESFECINKRAQPFSH